MTRHSRSTRQIWTAPQEDGPNRLELSQATKAVELLAEAFGEAGSPAVGRAEANLV